MGLKHVVSDHHVMNEKILHGWASMFLEYLKIVATGIVYRECEKLRGVYVDEWTFHLTTY